MFRYKTSVSLFSIACAALSISGAFSTPSKAAPLDYLFVGVQTINSGITNAQTGFPTINNNGDVAYISSDFSSIIVKNNDGTTVTRTISNLDPNRGHPINDSGQVLIERFSPSGPTVRTLDRINADGTLTTLATFGSDPTTTDYVENRGNAVYGSINNSGEVAIEVTTHSGDRQIIRISADGATHTVIDTQDATNGRFNFTDPMINDAGLVAYKAQSSAGGVDAYVGNGSAVAKAIELPTGEGNTGATVGINNNDVVAAQTPDSLLTGKDAGQASEVRNIIIDGTPPAPVEGFFGNAGINNFGQTAITSGNSMSDALLFGDQIILQRGNPLLGGVVNNSSPGPSSSLIRSVGDHAINDLGQVVFKAQTFDGTTTSTHIVRADPLGFSADNPVLPDRTPAPGSFEIDLAIVNALGVDAPIFVDPIVATGFTYSIGAGGQNFASLLVPDALPNGDSSFTVEFGSFSETLTAGTTFDFLSFDTLGFDTFSITGIDIAEMLDPTEAWIVGLTFVAGGFESVLSIEAITVDTDAAAIPLPAALPLLLGALGFFGLLGWRRKRMAAR